MMRIKNFSKFQHFKDRTPPWVKLYRDILDDPDWHELDPAAAKVLVMLWLIASEDETKQGLLPSVKKLAFRLRVSEKQLEQSLTKLSHWLIHDDIGLISERYQSDAPETERETEEETETDSADKKPSAISLKKFLESLNGEKVLPDDDPIFEYAERVGITKDALLICWTAFKDSYTASGKKQKDWRQTFRNAVRGNWYKIWFVKEDGTVSLTSNGRQVALAYSEAA